MNNESMTRATFDALVESTQALSKEQAVAESENLTEGGLTPMFGVLGSSAADAKGLLWSEVEFKIRNDDQIARYFIGDGKAAIEGLALWRRSNTRNDGDCTVE